MFWGSKLTRDMVAVNCRALFVWQACEREGRGGGGGRIICIKF